MINSCPLTSAYYPLLLKSRLNPIRERPEIRHALQFIVRQLDAEVMLQSRQQIKRLQAVDSQRLEKVVVGRKLLPWDLKMGRRKIRESGRACDRSPA